MANTSFQMRKKFVKDIQHLVHLLTQLHLVHLFTQLYLVQLLTQIHLHLPYNVHELQSMSC